MKNIIDVISLYRGSGLLLLVYAAAAVSLLIWEKDRLLRTFFVYLPFTILILFMLPPVYTLYSKIETATYYRLLWLVPMSLTIAYAGIRLSLRFLKKWWLAGAALTAALIILTGDCVYDNINISRAQNRLHLPAQVIDVCDYLLTDSEGEKIKAAFPTELAQFVRQYTSEIDMPFGREMLVAQWDYWNPVYEVMEKPETVDAASLAEEAREAECGYIVLSVNRSIKGDLAMEGYDILGQIDGFNIYRISDEKQ